MCRSQNNIAMRRNTTMPLRAQETESREAEVGKGRSCSELRYALAFDRSAPSNMAGAEPDRHWLDRGWSHAAALIESPLDLTQQSIRPDKRRLSTRHMFTTAPRPPVFCSCCISDPRPGHCLNVSCCAYQAGYRASTGISRV